MKNHNVWKKYENCIIAGLTIIVNLILLSICFDFYYDLNDDVMMKDIMAGVYTGTPDGHNMQTLYFLGAFISLCYRLCRNLPWYGLFLLLCQTGSLYLVGVRFLRFCNKWWAKAGCMALLTGLLWGILLPHMTAMQYTFTCTMLAAAAIFLFITTPKNLTVKQFICENIPSILLVILAYQLRTEMLLLVFPFIGLSGLFRLVQEDKILQKENYQKYGIVLECIVCGMLVSRLLDFAAYGSDEWKSFLTFFENRTQVYDFHMDILTSGEHDEYLTAIGLQDAQKELLVNYNFGLDEEIDEEMLGEIAVYAASGTDYFAGVPKAFRSYIYRISHKGDAPYNILILCTYFCICIMGICNAYADKKGAKRWNFLWELVLLGTVRSSLWMFIIVRGREPERITHSLYLAEAAVLIGMLCMQIAAGKRIIIGVLLGLLFVCYIPHNVRAVLSDSEGREQANQGAYAISQYCRAHPENFYFEDVYSTVGFSQKIFQNVDNSFSNYDIMGGWMCKSPLYREKLERFHIVAVDEALLYKDNVFFIMETQESSTDWMKAYYAGKGIAVDISQTEFITDDYAVYRVVEE